MEGLVFLIVLAIPVVVWLLLRPRPSDYDIAKIKIGDTKDQVIAAFGKPKDVKIGFGPEEWTYTIPFRLYVAIGFDSHGRVCSRYRSGEI